MKRLFFVRKPSWFWAAIFSLCVMLGASITNAQTTPTSPTTPTPHSIRPRLTPEQKLDRKLTRMQKKLSLTDAQVSQLREVMANERPQGRAVRDSIKALPKDQRMAAMKEWRSVRKANHDKIKSILTPQQWDSMHEMQRNEAARRREKRLEGQTPPDANKVVPPATSK